MEDCEEAQLKYRLAAAGCLLGRENLWMGTNANQSHLLAPPPLLTASPSTLLNPTSPTPKSLWISSSTQKNNNTDDVVSAFTPA